jgi:hypothetical protein
VKHIPTFRSNLKTKESAMMKFAKINSKVDRFKTQQTITLEELEVDK